jgi:PP-loop superfamily ATP-utilizing enzyme
VEAENIPKVAANYQGICSELKGLGFTFVTLDLHGYGTGSMNLELDELATQKDK